MELSLRELVLRGRRRSDTDVGEAFTGFVVVSGLLRAGQAAGAAVTAFSVFASALLLSHPRGRTDRPAAAVPHARTGLIPTASIAPTMLKVGAVAKARTVQMGKGSLTSSIRPQLEDGPALRRRAAGVPAQIACTSPRSRCGRLSASVPIEVPTARGRARPRAGPDSTGG